MDDQPQQPCRRSRRSGAVRCSPRRGTGRSWPSCRDRGSGTAWARVPRSRRAIVRAAWWPLCIATSARPGRPFSAIRSPTTNTSGARAASSPAAPRTRPARSTVAPARAASSRPSGDACTPAAQIFVRASMRPPLDVEAGRVDPDDPRAEADLDAEPLEVASRAPAQPLRVGREDGVDRVDQDDARALRVEAGGSSRAARGATARRSARPARRRSGRRRRSRTSAMARGRRRRARARRSRRRRRSARAAPARRRSSSSRARGARTRRGRSTTATRRWRRSGCRSAASFALPSVSIVSSRVVDVDVDDLAEHDPRVALAAQHVADRRGDVALGEHARGDLVEQRLEEVVVGAVDHHHLDRRAAQRLGGEQPARSRSRR